MRHSIIHLLYMPDILQIREYRSQKVLKSLLTESKRKHVPSSPSNLILRAYLYLVKNLLQLWIDASISSKAEPCGSELLSYSQSAD